MLLLDEPLYRRLPTSIPVLVRSYTRSLLALLYASTYQYTVLYQCYQLPAMSEWCSKLDQRLG